MDLFYYIYQHVGQIRKVISFSYLTEMFKNIVEEIHVSGQKRNYIYIYIYIGAEKNSLQCQTIFWVTKWL